LKGLKDFKLKIIGKNEENLGKQIHWLSSEPVKSKEINEFLLDKKPKMDVFVSKLLVIVKSIDCFNVGFLKLFYSSF